LLYPQASLFVREYSAIGFYADLAANGIDPWSIFDAQLRTASDLDAYAAARADTAFLTTIAKALVRERPLGDDWEQTGPGVTGHRGAVRITVTPRTTAAAGTRERGACGLGCAGRPAIEQSFQLEPFSTQPIELTLSGAVVQLVTTAPQAVLGFADGREQPLAAGVPRGCASSPVGACARRAAPPSAAGSSRSSPGGPGSRSRARPAGGLLRHSSA